MLYLLFIPVFLYFVVPVFVALYDLVITDMQCINRVRKYIHFLSILKALEDNDNLNREGRRKLFFGRILALYYLYPMMHVCVRYALFANSIYFTILRFVIRMKYWLSGAKLDIQWRWWSAKGKSVDLLNKVHYTIQYHRINNIRSKPVWCVVEVLKPAPAYMVCREERLHPSDEQYYGHISSGYTYEEANQIAKDLAELG